MPWNGSGVFQRLFSWAQDALNNVNIQGARMDQDTNDIVAGLNNALTRDGQGMPSAPINWNGQRLYNVAAPSVAADVATKGYVDTANAIQAKNMAGYQINNVGAPLSPNDAATKSYVDNASLVSSLPGLSTNGGKVLGGTGGNVTWVFPGISTTEATVTTATTLAGQYQYVPVAMGGALQAVTLPAATTLYLGGPHYWMRNTGTFPFELRDNTGVLLAVVPQRGQILVTLTDNTTTAGAWTIGNVSEYAFLSNYITGAITIDSNTGNLSSQQIQYFSPAANTFWLSWAGQGVIATLSGTTVSYGTIFTMFGTTTAMVSVGEISSTTVLCVTANGSGTIPQAVVATISGSTVTKGTAINLGTSSNNGVESACCALSSTVGLVIWCAGSSMDCEVVTMSGTTLTANAIFNIASVLYAAENAYTPTLTPLTSTTALAIGLSSAGNSMAAVVLTVSGTTPSTGIALTGIDTGCSANQVVPLGSNQYLVTYQNGTAVKMVVLTVSGTTVTAGTPVTVATGVNGSAVLQTQQGVTGYAYYAVSGTGYYGVPFTVSGSAITFSASPTLVSTTIGSGNQCEAFNVAGTAEDVLFGVNSSNFLYGQTVEFVK